MASMTGDRFNSHASATCFGDGGIDGVIDQDALGLDRVYVQAKRYGVENAVNEPEIRAFTGGLGAAKASKGVFRDNLVFYPTSQEFRGTSPFRIVLIDRK